MKSFSLAFRAAVLALTLVSVASCAVQTSSVQIIGGSSPNSELGFARATVAIGTARALDEGRGHCSGTLISSRFVLTAAHCVIDVYHRPVHTESLFVEVAGADGAERIGVLLWDAHTYAWLHEANKENPAKPPNDLALLLLRNEVSQGDFSAALATVGVKVHDDVVAAGFGRTEPDSRDSAGSLHTIFMQVSRHNSHAKRFDIEVPGGDRGVCHGDSGGSVFMKRGEGWLLAGVISGGPLRRNQTCRGPGWITPVSEYVEWVSSTQRILLIREERLE